MTRMKASVCAAASVAAILASCGSAANSTTSQTSAYPTDDMSNCPAMFTGSPNPATTRPSEAPTLPGIQPAPETPGTPPPLATPGDGITADFLTHIGGPGLRIAAAPPDATPSLSKHDAECIAHNMPFTHGVARAAILAQCTPEPTPTPASYPPPPAPTLNTTVGPPYLCWVIDSTSGIEDPPLGGLPPPITRPGDTPTPTPALTPTATPRTDWTFVVIINAQPGDPRAGGLVMAGG